MSNLQLPVSSLQLRNDTTANWTSNNPILKKGELAIEITPSGSYLCKVGDGSTAWNSLPYFPSYISVGDYIVQGVATLTNSTTKSHSGWVRSAMPYVAVSLSTAQTNSNYAVLLDIVSTSGDGERGSLIVFDRLNNGFKIGTTGTCTTYVIRWAIVNKLQQ